MLGSPATDQNAKQGAESSQLEVPLTLRREKNIMSKYINKFTALCVTPKNKSIGKPRETLVTPIPRHLERCYQLPPNCRTGCFGSIPPLDWPGY
ncbi:hypothetical protein TNCV_2395681 [Trichonephila clavipes]|nr:hypothetical protein TNCV_2395681 [Trichonephila clavipes]